MAGFRPLQASCTACGRRPDAIRLAQLVDGFLAVARCAPWDAAAADAHGSLRAGLAANRESLGAFDEMIAAHALALDAVLVTGNTRHFGRVGGLRMVDWIDRGSA